MSAPVSLGVTANYILLTPLPCERNSNYFGAKWYECGKTVGSHSEAVFPDHTLILDITHASEYLWATATAVLGEPTPVLAWRGASPPRPRLEKPKPFPQALSGKRGLSYPSAVGVVRVWQARRG